MPFLKAKKTTTIFFHSPFRCGSTFFFDAITNSKDVAKYYEVYNDFLSNEDFGKLKNIGSKSWISKHPYIRSYFLSYSNFFKNKKNSKIIKLIKNFKKTKSISVNEKNYFNALTQKNKLTCFFNTGYLKKIENLKNSIGGYHLLLIRNPFSQFNSILYLHKKENKFFYEFYLKKKLIIKKNKYNIKLIQNNFLDFYEKMIFQYVGVINICDKFIIFDYLKDLKYRKKITNELDSINPFMRINFNKFMQTFSFISEQWVNDDLINELKKRSKKINSKLTDKDHKKFEKKMLVITINEMKSYVNLIKYFLYEIKLSEKNYYKLLNARKRIEFINKKYEKLSLIYNNEKLKQKETPSLINQVNKWFFNTK